MYRSDEAAAEARRVELERELEEIEPRVDELEYLKWKQRELQDQVAAARAREVDFARVRVGVPVAPPALSQREIWAQRFAIVSTVFALSAIVFWVTSGGSPANSLTGACGVNVECGILPPAPDHTAQQQPVGDGMKDLSTSPPSMHNPTPHMRAPSRIRVGSYIDLGRR